LAPEGDGLAPRGDGPATRKRPAAEVTTGMAECSHRQTAAPHARFGAAPPPTRAVRWVPVMRRCGWRAACRSSMASCPAGFSRMTGFPGNETLAKSASAVRRNRHSARAWAASEAATARPSRLPRHGEAAPRRPPRKIWSRYWPEANANAPGGSDLPRPTPSRPRSRVPARGLAAPSTASMSATIAGNFGMKIGDLRQQFSRLESGPESRPADDGSAKARNPPRWLQ